MDLGDLLRKLNDQEVGETLPIEAQLVLDGSKNKDRPVTIYPAKFLLEKTDEESYKFEQIQGHFKMSFDITDFWGVADKYIRADIVNITETHPPGCTALFNHYTPTELRFEDVR